VIAAVVGGYDMAVQSIDTIAFRVVGERRDGSGHLLLLGDDGQYYAYAMDQCEVVPVEPDDSWRIDVSLAGDADSADRS
jgi:hypothetical protein